MTRINTNVSSLIGRNNLNRANQGLSQSLTRLSTGLRINTGKDDPAGLIASENLRSDITAIKRAISNTERANQVIATSDSALGQVSSLLNDIRGLVTESANSGALSDAQVKANQSQVDSSLAALNRIAQTTTFQGRRLLDGSLDFVTTAGNEFSRLSDLNIDQANLGATGSVAVDIEVTTAATQASVAVDGIDTAETPATGDLDIDLVASSANADISFTLTQLEGDGDFSIAGGTINIDAANGQALEGAAGNGGYTVNIFDDNVGASSYDAGTNTLNIRLDISNAGGGGAENTVADIATEIGTLTEFTASATAGGTNVVSTADGGSFTLAGGRDAGSAVISVETVATGEAVDVDVIFAEGGTPGVAVDGSGNVTVTIDNTAGARTSFADIAALIDGTAEFNASTTSTSFYDTTADAPPANTDLDNGEDAATETITITTVDGRESVGVTLAKAAGIGATPTVTGNADDGFTVTVDSGLTTSIAAIASALQNDAGITSATTTSTRSFVGANDESATASLIGDGIGIDEPLVFELSGTDGAEVLTFGAGTSVADLVAGINLVSDATGVTAAINATDAGTLDLTSSAYGSNSLVDISIISEGSGSTPAGTFTTAIDSGARSEGTDVIAKVNGVTATGDGNQLSINTATLDLQTTVEADFTGDIDFTITGGGALFQLGPDVVSNQQARLGIGSVNTARLGGVSGKLFQLGTGGLAELSSDNLNVAAKIIEEAIDEVTSLRGRLGAFQRTTLETNQNALNDTLTNLTAAESNIRDADFAEETANLTRSQILVQSGTRVLAIANQNPQNVLGLLG